MTFLALLNRPVICHRFLNVFCFVGMLVSAVSTILLALRWPAHLLLNTKLLILALFVSGFLWFLRSLRRVLVEQREQSPVRVPRAA